MSFKNRLFPTFLISFLITGQIGFAASFPTDKGSTVLQGSFSMAKSDDLPLSYYENRYRLAGSLSYMIIPDLAAGIWSNYEKISNGRNYFSDLMIGPQVTWFIGGHRHQTDIRGDFYQYFGLGYLHRRWEESQYLCDLNGCRDVKTVETAGTLRLSFGLMLMINNNIGVYGEGAEYFFNHNQLAGDLLYYETGTESTLDIGLILFLY